MRKEKGWMEKEGERERGREGERERGRDKMGKMCKNYKRILRMMKE